MTKNGLAVCRWRTLAVLSKQSQWAGGFDELRRQRSVCTVLLSLDRAAFRLGRMSLFAQWVLLGTDAPRAVWEPP